jgi:signal transduction protein with GAF and PtsI domain
VRHEDIPEINNPKIRYPVLEGDKVIKDVDNGGYNVHPVPPPNSEIKERIRIKYEYKRIKIEKLLTLGYTTSGEP